MTPHTTPRSLDTIDAELETAIAEVRRFTDRISHGRIFLVLDRFDKSTIGHTVTADTLTTDDIESIMTSRPHKGVPR